MSDHRDLAEELLRALSGKGAHVDTEGSLAGLDWRLAGRRPAGAPHSIHRIVNHLSFWQEFGLDWMGGEKPPTPARAIDSWPGDEEPADEGAWTAAVERFSAGLERLREAVWAAPLDAPVGDRHTRAYVLRVTAAHNSYHVGQVALLRRMLDAWPPPGGGETW